MNPDTLSKTLVVLCRFRKYNTVFHFKFVEMRERKARSSPVQLSNKSTIF